MVVIQITIILVKINNDYGRYVMQLYNFVMVVMIFLLIVLLLGLYVLLITLIMIH